MQYTSRAAQVAAILALLVAVSLLFGCAPKGPTYVEEGSSYTTATVTAVYDRADISKLSARQVSDAEKLRHQALSGLRARGGNAAMVADLITKTLQAETRAVPLYVEVATVAGKPAIVLVEAVGPKAGRFGNKRLWVLDSHGNVILAGSR